MTAHSISKDRLRPFYENVNKQADSVVKKGIVGYLLIGLLLALFRDTTWLAAIAGAIITGLYFLLRTIAASTLRYFVSSLFLAYSLQFLFQMQGLYITHAFFFISVVVLLFYEDWRVVLPVTFAYSILLAVLFFIQGNEFFEKYLFASGTISVTTFILHQGAIWFYGALCMMWAWLQHKQTTDSAVRALQMEDQLSMMEVNRTFADHISQGNLNAVYNSDQPDQLGASLLNMQKSLLEATQREEQDKFINIGLAHIGELLRLHVEDIHKLCDEVLKHIVKYMHSNQGSIFMLDTHEEESYLQLMSAYAWDRKKYIEKTVSIGEGLIGQAVIEKSTLYMTRVPEDYVAITSGLGQANPSSIIIVPLKNEDQVIGVIELASFTKFEKFEIEFLEKVGQSIASTMISSKNNQRNKELLEQSKVLTEQLRAQEEEMRQNMEEMQATQEEMIRTQRELNDKATAVQREQDNLRALINNTDDSIIAMDKDYRIIVINDVLKKRYKGSQYESLDAGADALVALGSVRDEWKGYYDRALKGERLQFVLKSSVKGEDAFREYFINPMRSQQGEIIGLSVVSRDVTQRHLALQEMEREGHIINAIINTTNDSFLAIDKQYKILVVNTIVRERYRRRGVVLNEGDFITEKLPADFLAIWKPRYDKVLAGESIHFSEERKSGDQYLYVEVYMDAIRDEQGDVIGCAVVTRDITAQKKAADEANRLRKLLTEEKRVS